MRDTRWCDWPPAPVIGLRYRIVLTVVGLAVALGAPLAASSDGAKRNKHCPHGQVTRTIKYVHHRGGPVDHATGCVTKKVIVPTSFAGVQSKIRALALTFVPAGVARRFLGKAARRVAATDAKTDGALSADVTSHAPPLAAKRDVRARAAARAPARDGSGVTAEPGTETRYLHRYTKLDTADDIGESFVSGSITKATRVTGGLSASSTKTLTVTHLINKCPDAAGTAHGTLDFSLRDLRIAGPRTITETSTLHAQILAHFDDTAHVASAEVAGTWSFAISTRHTQRSVGGDVAASNFRQTEARNFVDLTTTVTTGTDDAIVTGGAPLGVWVAEALAHEYIQDMLNSIPSGVCVNIVPDSPTVHVTPGGTVAIVAHLTDHHGQTFPGPISEYNPLDRVSPTKAAGNPDATFTYAALATAPAGETDVVQLSHISKRGKGVGGTVTVVYDRFPARFQGTWTRILTTPNASQGWTETVHGTATYVLSTSPPQVGQTAVHYDVQSASVDWSVTGSVDNSGAPGCTVSYSGSGTDSAMDDPSGNAELTLEDVRNGAHTAPYYYSIYASGDFNTAPQYDVHHTPQCNTPDYQSSIATTYLDVGCPHDSGCNSVPAEMSDTFRLLAGHRVGTDFTGIFHTDTTWSFTASG